MGRSPLVAARPIGAGRPLSHAQVREAITVAAFSAKPAQVAPWIQATSGFGHRLPIRASRFSSGGQAATRLIHRPPSQASESMRKIYRSGFAKRASAAIMRAAREDAGVAERDGFEIRCISDGT